jgi:fatty acid desaturase
MQLSLKQKALAQTLGLFALAIVGAVAVAFIIANFSAIVLFNALGVGLFAWFGYLFYSITLSRLEYNETLKKMTEKKD